MLTFKQTLKMLMLGVMALLLLSSQAQAEEKPLKGKNLVVFVSSSDVDKAGMGITIGMAASAQAGANVTIVVGAGATQYILKDAKKNHFNPMNKSLQEITKMAIESGANVYLCGMFAKANGLTNADLVEGAKVVEGADIFAKLYATDARSMSF